MRRPPDRSLLTGRLAALSLAIGCGLFLASCGAPAPRPADPCARGGCAAGPLDAPSEGPEPGEAGDDRRDQRLQGEDEVDTLRCKALPPGEHPSGPPAHCRVQVGPLRLGPTEGPAGVSVGLTNTEPTDLQDPPRRRVEPERDLEGRR